MCACDEGLQGTTRRKLIRQRSPEEPPLYLSEEDERPERKRKIQGSVRVGEINNKICYWNLISCGESAQYSIIKNSSVSVVLIHKTILNYTLEA